MKTAKTDLLINSLAKQAGQSAHLSPSRLGLLLVLGSVMSVGILFTAILLLLGARNDLTTALHEPATYFKLAAMLSLAVVTLYMTYRAISPDRQNASRILFSPTLAIILLWAATDQSNASWLGASEYAVISCVLTIIIASLLPLLIIFGLLRLGAPVAPTRVGAIVGMLAGALAATAYTITCRNDSGLFLLIWYPFAVAIVAAFGAAVGRRFLAW
ncbi:NrsF family protein [Thalassospira indica]|uniref:DUF1109 domain-containing protein n=1 Tax=Thalassospira indica TaxID=1891279 RepID=A0ABN5NFQ0_9PROT|nr:DUF1109 domain-containing protein [Thalassospira indica]AXO14321.1 DUF1109 domain-containing protein [Thalassospira indica]OAZ09271.1 hypothetical protein TH15_20615 [Thalassospira profundimaris]